jgi:hypothetical protein
MTQGIYARAEAFYVPQRASMEAARTNYLRKKFACIILSSGLCGNLAASLYFVPHAFAMLPSLAGIGLTTLFYLKVRKEFIAKFSQALQRPCGEDNLLFMDVAARKAEKRFFDLWNGLGIQLAIDENAHREAFYVKHVFSNNSSPVDKKIFLTSCEEGYLGVLRAIFQKFPKSFSEKPVVEEYWQKRNDYRIMLHFGARFDRPEIVEACVNEFHIPVDLICIKGERRHFVCKKTPLHVAVEWGNVHALNMLITCRADVNAPFVCMEGLHHELMPIHLAAIYDQPDVIRILLQNRADPYVRTKGFSYNNQTALHLAMRVINVAAIRELLQREINVDIPDERRLYPVQSLFEQDRDQVDWFFRMDRFFTYYMEGIFRFFPNTDPEKRPRNASRTNLMKKESLQLLFNSPQGRIWKEVCKRHSFVPKILMDRINLEEREAVVVGGPA